MSKLSKEELARFSGAEWILHLIDEKGLEEAKKEFDNRNIRGIPLKCRKEDVLKLYESERNNIIMCLTMVSAIVLHDEFDFGAKRLQKYIKRFNNEASCIVGDYVNWQDLQQILLDETGLLLDVPEKVKKS